MKVLKNIFLISLLAVIASCNDGKTSTGYEYMPDMYRSPDYETYSPNPVFKDSMTAQPPVPGTIARGNNIYTAIDRLPYPYANDNDGYEAAGRELHNPLEKTDVNMAEGKRLYENYCTHCHGATGQGAQGRPRRIPPNAAAHLAAAQSSDGDSGPHVSAIARSSNRRRDAHNHRLQLT